MDKNFWLPPSSRPSKPPPSRLCRCCGAAFSIDEARKWELHVDKCYDRHEDEIRSQSPREHAPHLFGAGVGDDEQANWIKRNKKAILEGKVKM